MPIFKLTVHHDSHGFDRDASSAFDNSLAGLEVIEHPLPEGLDLNDFLALMALAG